jgi:hypothetical protein
MLNRLILLKLVRDQADKPRKRGRTSRILVQLPRSFPIVTQVHEAVVTRARGGQHGIGRLRPSQAGRFSPTSCSQLWEPVGECGTSCIGKTGQPA